MTPETPWPADPDARRIAYLDATGTARCDDDDHRRAASCTCLPLLGCAGPGEAGCCWCNHRDPYDPCPVVGFGCGWPGAPACECCSPEQFAASMVSYTPVTLAE